MCQVRHVERCRRLQAQAGPGQPGQGQPGQGLAKRCLAALVAAPLALSPFALAFCPQAATAQTVHRPRYDYPTTTRADYVIGCMAANGFKRELLDRCACGIDTIADAMTYDDYEKASTVLSMQQAGVGPRVGLFRDTPIAREELQKLRRAQADVNLRCG